MTNEAAFKEGSIRSIRLKNFVTYDDVEAKFGPHLNVIIGPNGTGKSTLVCAICLGLGFDAKLLGRAKQPDAFIKDKKNRCEIELELHVSKGENIRVKRVISRENGNVSEFYINGRRATKANVHEINQKYNIELDNLCQFLPQDMVSEFAKCDPKRMLELTQRALGNAEMLSAQEQLIDLQNNEKRKQEEIERMARELENESARVQELEPLVTRDTQRRETIGKLDMLRQYERCLVYAELKHEANTKMEEVKAASARLKELSEASSENKQKRNEAKEAFAKAEGTNKAKKNQIDQAFGVVKKKNDAIEQEADDCERKLETVEKNRTIIREKTKKRQQCEIEIRKAEKEIEELEAEQIGDSQGLSTEAERELKEKKSDLSRERNKLDAAVSAGERRIADINRSINEIDQDIRRMDDMKNRRLENLKRRFGQDICTVVNWLENNRQLFRQEVFEPVMMTVTVDDPRMANRVEQMTSHKFLSSFVVQNKDDMDVLTREVRDVMKLPINVLQAPPPTDNVESQRLTPELQQMGIKGYLPEFYNAPIPVKRALAKHCNHRYVAVGDQRVRNNLEPLHSKGVQLVFDDDTLYKTKYSRDRKFMVISNITEQGTAFGKPQDNSQDKQAKERERIALLEEKKNQEAENAECKKRINVVLHKIQDITNQFNARVEMLKKVNGAKNKLKNLQTRLHQIQADIQRAEADLETAEQAYRRLLNKRAIRTLELQEAVEDLWRFMEGAPALEIELAVAEAAWKRAKRMCDEESAQEQQLQQEYNSKRLEFDALKQRANDMKKAHQRGDAIIMVENTAEYATISAQYPDKEQADTAIAEAEALLASMPSVEPGVLAEYEERKANAETLQAELDKMKTAYEHAVANMEQLKDKWLVPLKQSIEQISAKFEQYFQEINCEGQVLLAEHTRFSEYGIDIMVRFRANEKLQRLTAHHQSGGERSVSTMLYLMALQDQAVCPFRVVDEINQGMDAQNERAVFSTIAKVAAQPNTSQYFLITPKLLPKLDYDENMTVLCVFNGPYMLPHQEYDVSNFLKIRAAVGA